MCPGKKTDVAYLLAVEDSGFRLGGTNPQRERQHKILPNKCMNLKEFGPEGVQNFTM